MKKLLNFLFVGFVLLQSSCSNDIYEGICRRDPVVVDGKSDDWMMPLRFSDSKTKLNYNVTNDNENLYFAFRLTDENMIRGFMQSGMQITIDKSGKKKMKPGYAVIRFPVQKRGKPANPPEKGFDPLSGKENDPAQIPFEAEFKGFKSLYNGTYKSGDKPDVEFVMCRDKNNVLFCEMKVPFKSFYNEMLVAEDNSKLIGIKFTFQSSAGNQERQDMPGGGQGRGPGGQGGAPGNGRQGGRPGGGGGMPPSGDGRGNMPQGEMHGQPDSGPMRNAKMETATVNFRIKLAVCK